MTITPSIASAGEREASLRREAQAWLVRLTSGQVTSGDAEAFRAWCGRSPAHARAFAEARVLWDSLEPAVRRARQREPAATSTAARHRRMTRRAFLGGAVAASAALVTARSPFGLWPTWSDMAADYRTGTGQQRQLSVAPGVTVELNTQTAVNLRKEGRGVVGMELLSGEAQVMTDNRLIQPFVVFVAGSRVLAQAATQCNVRCTGPEASVICINGRTELICDGASTRVRPAEQIRFDQQGIGAASRVDPEVALSWRRRVLTFNNEPLSDVVAEINRYRPGELIITNSALGARRVQARLPLNEIDTVVALIHDSYGARVTRLPGGIVLLS